MKEFMNREDVFSFTATKTLLAQIDRAVRQLAALTMIIADSS